MNKSIDMVEWDSASPYNKANINWDETMLNSSVGPLKRIKTSAVKYNSTFHKKKTKSRQKIKTHILKKQLISLKENYNSLIKNRENSKKIEKSHIDYFNSFCIALEKNTSIKVKHIKIKHNKENN